MYYQGGKLQPLSQHITSFSKKIAEDMLGLFYFYFISFYCFNCFCITKK